MKNISLGAKRLSGCHCDCVQQRRRDEDEIARGNVIVLQLDLIGAAPGENARKFRFLVPVCADGRVQLVECGDIFLQWKKLFSVPGVGRYFVQSISDRDSTLIMGFVMFFGVFVIICNLISDILLAIIDPRVKLSK